MPEIVASVIYEGGRRVGEFNVHGGVCLAPEEGRFVWIGLYEPGEEILRQVQQLFGLHDLAIEDAHRAHQRPKLEVYDDSLFLVLRTAQLIKDKIEFGETHVFAGKGYIVSIRHGASSSYADVRARCERAPMMLRQGEAFVVHAIMDFVVDNYFPIIDTVAADLAEIEDHIFSNQSSREEIERIYRLRAELRTLRRTVTPLLDVCNRFMRPDLPLITGEIRPYFRDVYDHVLKVNESIDNLSDSLRSAFETSLLLASSNQNEVMKRLAGWAAILAVPTAIAGIYGMNFEHMPELKWEYGYFTVVALIAGLCGFLYWRLKRVGWL